MTAPTPHAHAPREVERSSLGPGLVATNTDPAISAATGLASVSGASGNLGRRSVIVTIAIASSPSADSSDPAKAASPMGANRLDVWASPLGETRRRRSTKALFDRLPPWPSKTSQWSQPTSPSSIAGSQLRWANQVRETAA
jgi:hypothetical protein